jgi:hypothetical protein
MEGKVVMDLFEESGVLEDLICKSHRNYSPKTRLLTSPKP